LSLEEIKKKLPTLISNGLFIDYSEPKHGLNYNTDPTDDRVSI